MNRREFMNRLEQLLQGISEEERRDALQYYEDYFEDAGPQREQEVMRELGSPEKVAQSIWESVQQAQWNQSTDGNPYQQQPQNPQNPQMSQKKYTWLIVLLLIVTAPVTLPLIGTAASVFLGIVGSIIGFFVGAIGLFIGAVVLLNIGFAGLGFLCLGLGCGALCITFLLIPLLGFICQTVLPWLFQLIKSGIAQLNSKGGFSL